MQLLPELTPVFTFICVTLYIGTYAIGLGGLPWFDRHLCFQLSARVEHSRNILRIWSSRRTSIAFYLVARSGNERIIT
jgi:hypothetical protein